MSLHIPDSMCAGVTLNLTTKNKFGKAILNPTLSRVSETQAMETNQVTYT